MFHIIYSENRKIIQKRTHKTYKNTNETNLKHMQFTDLKEKLVIPEAMDKDA